MIELLKEMGKVCDNREMAMILKQFHKNNVEHYLKMGFKAKAKENIQQLKFWSKKIADMDRHIEWLHKSIQEGSYETN